MLRSLKLIAGGLSLLFAQNSPPAYSQEPPEISEESPHACVDAEIIINQENPSSRDLTYQERTLLQGIFGNELNLENLALHFYSEEAGCSAGFVQNDHEVHFTNLYSYSENFALESDPVLLGLFMHEIIHVLQYQQNPDPFNDYNGPKNEVYVYELSPENLDFDSYHSEQQGVMIADYIVLYLSNIQDFKLYMPDTENAEDILREIVERRFPAARETRLEFERTGRLPWESTQSFNPPRNLIHFKVQKTPN